MQFALFDLPWWAYVVVTLGLTHVTIVAVTIYLHRHQAHSALDLHPVASHFFRLWLWLTTGMVTRVWVAIHRKHHAATETLADPHSPQIHGIRKVLFEGAELYRVESLNAQSMQKFGHGTPDDWIERKLYARHSVLGVSIMLVIEVLLFGPIGLTMWAVQMLWIPFFAAGVINGIGHYWGYRNFAPSDASTNIVPWGILIGGEELHNNHHAYISSARFSSRWWEFDIGWLYIRLLEMCHLAKVRRVAPRVHFGITRIRCDEANLQAVIMHRYEVLARFAKALQQTVDDEAARMARDPNGPLATSAARHMLLSDGRALPARDRAALDRAVHSSKVLACLHAMREELAALWGRSSASKAELVRRLEEWCARAEKSGISALRDFAGTLRRYELPSADMR